MSFHNWRKTPVEPVKCKPAKCLFLKITSPATGPSTVTMLITPSGTPAALNNSIITCAEYTCESAGFQTTTFPIIAGAAHKFAAIDVKLNGVKANTNPSNGRYCKRFHIPGNDSGCSL